MSDAAAETRPLAWYVDGLVETRDGAPASDRRVRVVQSKRERTVWRVQADGLVWFAKRGVGSKRAEIRREAENARALMAEGLGAVVLASGSHDGAEWLVTQAAGLPFDLLLGERGAQSYAAQHRAILADAARLVRALHTRGWAFPDLSCNHVLGSRRGGPLVVIDAARLERTRSRVRARVVARDFAALLFSLGPPRLGDGARVSATDRVRLVRDAAGLCGDDLRRLLAAIDGEIRRLALRTRWRRGFGAGAWALITATGGLDDPALLDDFEILAGARGATVVRTLPDRENRTIGRDADGRPLFYVKAFPPTKRGFSPAMDEVAAIDLFLRNGIPVNRLAGYAEDVEKGSVVAVAACAGEPLDDLLRRGVAPADRRALAIGTARIWRRMRECGLRHRDAYACHVFAARTPEPARFDLRLIDMTRAGRAPWPKERWFVKDAAQLWHGVRPAGATATDAVRWLREYFRVPRLTRTAKRFAAKVAAKERSISVRQQRRTLRASTVR